MYIKVEDLKKGDEILLPAGSNLIHAILLRDPVKVDKGRWYKNTKCSICAEVEQYDKDLYDWKLKTTTTKIYNRTKYGTDVVNGNRIDKYMNLQDYKMIWLLNRNVLKNG